MEGANLSYRIRVEPLPPDLLLRYAQMPRPCAGGVLGIADTNKTAVCFASRGHRHE